MKTIDTSVLTCLGVPGKGPWRLGEDRLVRLAQGGVPFSTEEQAQSALAVYRAARDVGANTPDAFGSVRVGGGYGIVVEFVEGVSLGMHMAIGTYSPRAAGLETGVLQRELHSVRMDVGIDWKRRFCRWARAFGSFLPEGTGARLVSLVEAIPSRNSFLHGDLHIVNAIVTEDALVPIDLESAGFGHPVFDLAITYSRVILSIRQKSQFVGLDEEYASVVAHDFWRAHLEGYFGGPGSVDLEEMERVITVLAKIENCRFAYGEDANYCRSAQQDEQLSCAIALLEDELPRLSRLYF